MSVAITPPPRRRVPHAVAVLAPVVGLVALGLCGLVLLGIGAAKVGPAAVAVGAAAALLPVFPVLGAFLWIDRWEPEPAKLLWLGFFWGACGAALCAATINSTAEVLGDVIFGRGSGDVIAATISAPIVEEAAKGIFLIGLLWLRRQEFDGLVDGIVYAGFTAAGFAFTENIYYFGRVFAEFGFGNATSGVVALFIFRGVLAPFTHPLFTCMTGIGVGIAARAQSHKVRIAAPLLGYLGAVLLHSLWNASSAIGGTSFTNIYFLVMVPIFTAVILVVMWQRSREHQVIVRQLPNLVAAKLIPESESRLLATLAGRKKWQAAVRKRSGRIAARAVGQYQTAVTELAFLSEAEQRGTAGQDRDQRRADILATLQHVRAVVGSAGHSGAG